MEDQIVICKECGMPEFEGSMTWLAGRCLCRHCYKAYYREVYGKDYRWGDKDVTADEQEKLRLYLSDHES